MAKVTSKLQVTLPKAIANRYGIRPGDEIEWMAAGDVIRVVPVAKRAGRRRVGDERTVRLGLFDAATARQRQREAAVPKRKLTKERGWRRVDLYERGRPG